MGDRLLLGWFSGFPGGRAGFALLMLRVTPGVALLSQGTSSLRGTDHAPELLCGLSAIGGGVLLIIGFLTPIAAVLIGLFSAGVALSLLPPCAPALFDTKLTEIFALAILLAVVLLGPGAFSVDARLFGRREIIIPRSPK